jgi:hypothetical protein
MKRPLLKLLALALVLWVGVALGVGPASAREKSAESSSANQPVNRKVIAFHELTFEIPVSGWERSGDQDSGSIQFIHKYGEHGGQSIAIWPVEVPPPLRGAGPSEQASKYFEAERLLPRYPGHWEGFREEQRLIGGKPYPVMKYLVTFPASKPWTPVTDGLLLLYFPQDFQTRQRFYVLMWQDIHPTGDKGQGLNDLDAIVSSFRVLP